MVRVLYCDPEKQVVIENMKLPALNKDQVRVKTVYSYLSAGTELTMLQMGQTNNTCEVTRDPLGYSLSGEVIEVGANVTHVKPGDNVACVGAGALHTDEAIVAKNLVSPVPAGVSLREAAPAAMMCFALGGIRRARLEFGENVLVLGGGAMGQIAAQLAQACGCHVYMMDLNESRLAKANNGIITVTGNDAGWERIRTETAPVVPSTPPDIR